MILFFESCQFFLKNDLCPPSVSQAIQAINEAVDNKDTSQTLAALRSPAAGMYGVTSECAQTYQDDLLRIKDNKRKEGEIGSSADSLIFSTNAYRHIYTKIIDICTTQNNKQLGLGDMTIYFYHKIIIMLGVCLKELSVYIHLGVLISIYI